MGLLLWIWSRFVSALVVFRLGVGHLRWRMPWAQDFGVCLGVCQYENMIRRVGIMVSSLGITSNSFIEFVFRTC